MGHVKQKKLGIAKIELCLLLASIRIAYEGRPERERWIDIDDDKTNGKNDGSTANGLQKIAMLRCEAKAGRR